MTANLPTDAIEECIQLTDAFAATDPNSDSGKKRRDVHAQAVSQLRALKDAALAFRALSIPVDGVQVRLGHESRLANEPPYPVLIVHIAGSNGPRTHTLVAPIVNGLPVLDDAARRALGERGT